MKKVAFTLVTVICALSGFSQTSFTLSGKITTEPNTKVSLSYISGDNKTINDTCFLKNGEFNFKGNILEPQMVFLSIYKGSYRLKPDDDPNKISFFLEPGNISITASQDNFKESKIEGSKSQNEYMELQTRYAGLTKEYKIIADNFDSALAKLKKAKEVHESDKIIDSLHEKVEAIRQQYQDFQPRYLSVDRQFIDTHPSSYVSAFQLKIDYDQWSYDSVKMLYKALSVRVQNSYDGRQIQKMLQAIENSSPGKKAKDFTTTDINGKQVILSAFKGRVVLLDFWASWCGPCRASTPHLIELYKKYNKSGLDVIAIADDDHAKDAWTKAIAQDNSGLWYNVLRGFQTGKESDDISNKFAVHLLPTRILIDQNGVILARYTGTEDADALDKKLAEIFK